jgi:hypothetical protein
LTASADIAKRPPIACAGPERFRVSLSWGNPGDQRSPRLSAIGLRSFQSYETGSLVLAQRLR